MSEPGGPASVPRIAAVPAAPDPLAEVARLRDPAGPWLHLLWGAPADARQFGWLLAGEGLASRVLRGPSVRTTYGLYDEAAAALQFPGDLVPDWAAFASLLRDLSWLPGPAGQVLVITRGSLLLAAAPTSDLTAFVSAVVTVATERAGRREPALHVVLADDAVGLAVLRARLRAIPAGVRDVVGWVPEEPSVALGAGGRATFEPGPPDLDACDHAVLAVAGSPDILEVRRGGEIYHGPPSDPVRTYGVVLSDPARAVAVAADIGAAVAAVPAACVVLPIAANPSARGDRETSFLANSTPVRPAATPAPPDPEPAAVPVPPSPPEPEPEPTPAPGPGSSDEVDAGAEVPADDPDAGFALVAADLEWEFAQGSPENDPVDESLVAAAEHSGVFTAIFRTWTRDPGAGWVRVLVGYAATDADAARSALITAAQSGGARRTCVEVVTEADVSDVHRWLERQCVALWAAPPTPAPPAPMPSVPGPSAPGPSASGPSAPGPSAPVPSASGPSASAPSASGPLAAARPAAGPAAAGPDAAAREPTPEGGDAETSPSPPPEAGYGPAPSEPGEAAQRLIDWAASQSGIVAVVAALADGAPVYGLVLEPAADPAAALPEATQALADNTATLVPLVPSAGLSPANLKLYRAATRLWTRPTDRPARATTSTAYDPGPKIDLTNFEDNIERVEVEDETIDDFTLYALTLTETLSEDPPGDPDGTDEAIVAWAKEHPNLLAAARATVTTHDQQTRVYLLAADPDADPPEIRHAAARVMAAHNHTEGAVQVFCPLDPIPRFYIDIYRVGTQLWRSDRKLTPRDQSEDPPS